MKKYLMSAAAMLCTVAALAQATPATPATPGAHPGGRKHGSHEGQHRKKGTHAGGHRHKGMHGTR